VNDSGLEPDYCLEQIRSSLNEIRHKDTKEYLKKQKNLDFFFLMNGSFVIVHFVRRMDVVLLSSYSTKIRNFVQKCE